MNAYTEFEATKESLPQRINVDDLAASKGYLKTSSLGLRRKPNRPLHAAHRNSPTLTRANENPSQQLNTKISNSKPGGVIRPTTQKKQHASNNYVPRDLH